MIRVVVTLWILGVALLIVSLFPTTESMEWVLPLAGSAFLLGASAATAIVASCRNSDN